MNTFIKFSVFALLAIACATQTTHGPSTLSADANLTIQYWTISNNGNLTLRVNATLVNQNYAAVTNGGYWIGLGFLGDASNRSAGQDYVNCTIGITGVNKTNDNFTCFDNSLDANLTVQRDAS